MLVVAGGPRLPTQPLLLLSRLGPCPNREVRRQPVPVLVPSVLPSCRTPCTVGLAALEVVVAARPLVPAVRVRCQPLWSAHPTLWPQCCVWAPWTLWGP